MPDTGYRMPDAGYWILGAGKRNHFRENTFDFGAA